jgi:methylenetetrahydrofolate reductase (NADPH)
MPFMSLRHCFSDDRPALSFELFPPRTAVGEDVLYEHVARLMEFWPDFITCTYGAGGSTRDKTLEIIARVRQQFDVAVASHLTLVDATRDDLRRYLAEAGQRGIGNIVALRGDPPSGRGYFQAAPGGFRNANELVALIRSEFPEFGIAVAGYPETHQEAPDPDTDMLNLKRKVDAGADVVITQLFFDNQFFFRFRDRCRAAGIKVPIVPGLLPALSLQQVKKITALCGSTLPESFAAKLAEKPDDPQWQMQVGVEHATDQVCELLAGEVDGLHFYVLNKSEAAAAILSSLKDLGLGVSRRDS